MIKHHKANSITGIICTCNRCEILDKILRALTKINIPERMTFDLLVIDNNSKDATKEVVERFQTGSGNFPVNYVLETMQGISFARNRGVCESKGHYIAFLDDDVIPRKNYLQELMKAIQRFPYVRTFGGKTKGVYRNKPDWFITEGPYRLQGALGSYDLGPKDIILGKNDVMPITSNAIFRRDLFDEVGLFRTDLGRKSGSKYVLSFEDTEFFERICSNGDKIVYLSHVIVDHYVSTERFNKAKLKNWFYGSGIVLAKMNKPSGSTIFDVPRYLLKEIGKLFFKIAFNKVSRKKDASFYFLTRLWIYLGMIKYYRHPTIVGDDYAEKILSEPPS